MTYSSPDFTFDCDCSEEYDCECEECNMAREKWDNDIFEDERRRPGKYRWREV